MWYQSVNKIQFRSYVRQDTRLNAAYWIATKGVQMCEEQTHTAAVKRRITAMRIKVDNLLDAVKHELSTQDGLAKDLIQHLLKYVESYCVKSLGKTKLRIEYVRTGLEIPGEKEQIANEMAFIKDRAEMIPGSDLLEEYDRAIYLIYQAVAPLQNGNAGEIHTAGMKQRLAAACDLMTPGFTRIQQHCNEYIGHLYLPPEKSLSLINQQIVDYSAMFSAGLSLARLYRLMVTTAEDQQTEPWTDNALTRYQKDITNRSNIIQSSLIESNLARANNVGHILDREIFNSQERSDFAIRSL